MTEELKVFRVTLQATQVHFVKAKNHDEARKLAEWDRENVDCKILEVMGC